ncbi:DNA topoisomerase IV, alpha subunit [Wallemia mellicola]|uniref:DNA topoisomerase (ATP-hydrolyzing) n=1 Tax=Wallemia mellicola TaxID=1708541 RepID=A0A4T0R8M4_9BASI|nr:DNA topoisomerase IV, alpha subunit [Wallemia mellicola]
MLLVINYVLNALESNRKVNIRGIYYQNVDTFKKQSNVQALLKKLTEVLEVRRAALNVRPSHKGLFLSSALSIQLNNGNVVMGSDTSACHIPTCEDISQLDVVGNTFVLLSQSNLSKSQVSFVLVVEKETVFSALREIQFSRSSVHGHNIILTLSNNAKGKGYPDIATRDLLNHLANVIPEKYILSYLKDVPFIGLVDSDPHGLRIFLTYKFGSENMQQEKLQMACPRLKLMGLRNAEFDLLCIPPNQALSITKKEKTICKKMIQRLDLMDRSAFGVKELKWDRDEIKQMVTYDRKFEIEALYSAPTPNGETVFSGQVLGEYIDSKLTIWLKQQAILDEAGFEDMSSILSYCEHFENYTSNSATDSTLVDNFLVLSNSQDEDDFILEQ